MKKSILNTIMFTVILSLAVLLSSCEKDDDNPIPLDTTESIAEIASANSDFSILVEALTKAGLVNTFLEAGNYTVFAPTNDAFNALFDSMDGVSGIDDLSSDDLTPILKYHVLNTKVMSTAIQTGYVTPLQEVSLLIEAGSSVTLNGSANVTTADIEASNGVIHIIDEVLIPPTIVDIAIDNSNFSSLVAAVVKADLVETLSGTGPFTVFAPTDDAFDQLFTDLGVSGIDDIDVPTLTAVLTYHVVSGKVLSTDLSSGPVTTLNGTIQVDIDGSSVTINTSSNITAVDIMGTNGVVHVIDEVLLPPTK